MLRTRMDKMVQGSVIELREIAGKNAGENDSDEENESDFDSLSSE